MRSPGGKTKRTKEGGANSQLCTNSPRLFWKAKAVSAGRALPYRGTGTSAAPVCALGHLPPEGGRLGRAHRDAPLRQRRETDSLRHGEPLPSAPAPAPFRQGGQAAAPIRVCVVPPIGLRPLATLPQVPFPSLLRDGPPTPQGAFSCRCAAIHLVARLRKLRPRFVCHWQRETAIPPEGDGRAPGPCGTGRRVIEFQKG